MYAHQASNIIFHPIVGASPSLSIETVGMQTFSLPQSTSGADAVAYEVSSSTGSFVSREQLFVRIGIYLVSSSDGRRTAVGIMLPLGLSLVCQFDEGHILVYPEKWKQYCPQ